MSMNDTHAAPRKFVVIACEASGDLLGEGLVSALKDRFPGCSVEGIGGEKMAAAGMLLWKHYDELSVMGLVEVLKHLPRLLKLRKWVLDKTLELSPDAFIGIDGPDFNLGLEKKLKRAGIKTVHYVSPSIWAWREGRAKTIKQSADRVLCLFPMEPPIYDKYGMASTYVGHPLAADFETHPEKALARRRLEIEVEGRWLGILPGSRQGEIERLGRVFMQAALLIHRKHPDIRFLIPMASARARDALLKVIDDLHIPRKGDEVVAEELEWASVRVLTSVVAGKSHDVMKASDVLLLASGTAALEGLLAKRPMVVAYKIAPLTHFIVKGLGILKIDRYSLPNILAQGTVVQELMQDDCTAPKVAAALLNLLENPAASAMQVERFHDLHEGLRGSGSFGAAQAVGEVIGA